MLEHVRCLILSTVSLESFPIWMNTKLIFDFEIVEGNNVFSSIVSGINLVDSLLNSQLEVLVIYVLFVANVSLDYS